MCSRVGIVTISDHEFKSGLFKPYGLAAIRLSAGDSTGGQ